MSSGPTNHEETLMQDQWISAALTASSLPVHTANQDQRLQQQVSTYLLYRSLSTDERNRRSLEGWREAQHRHGGETR